MFKKKSLSHRVLVFFAVLFVAFLGFGLIQAIQVKGTASAEAASWIQAIGSIGAIGVAIWVTSRQHMNDLKRDTDNERMQAQHLLQSLHDEIDVTVRAFQQSAGGEILKTTGAITFRVYLSPSPFKVYMAHIGRIGTVPDQVLRTKIIELYTQFDLLLLGLEINNDCFGAYESAKTLVTNNPSALNEVHLTETRKRLADRGIVVRSALIDCKDRASEILIDLKRGIEELKIRG